MSLKRTWQRRQITPTRNGQPTKTSKRLRSFKIKILITLLFACFTASQLISLSNAISSTSTPILISQPHTAPHTAPTAEDIKAEITRQAELFNLSPQKMIALAECESNLNPTAKNPNSTARGLYQYLIGTWEETQSAHNGLERNNYKANIREAMLDVANGEAWRWPECRIKANL
ncbi:MAG: transglycosylase SLT domain-containing protein [Rickettsiaceae bacterium]|nr:transglycosylase SLT domain-containing protein [Rickettsiaceae bacterium]